MRKEYTKKEIEKAILPYDVGQVLNYKIFEVGIDNTNIYIKTKKKEGVLKIYEMYSSKDLAFTQFELSLMKKCYQCSLPVPQVFKTKTDKIITSFKGKLVVFISFLPGENIFDKQISLKLIEQIGEAAAKLDKCLIGFKPPGQERKEHYWDLKRYHDTEKYLPYLKFDKSIDHKIIYQTYNNHKKIVQPKFKKCQKGYIHNDIAAHNILARGDKLTAILDFGDAIKAYFITEVAVSIAQLCLLQKNWQNSIKTFIKAYQNELALNKTEKSILYYLVLCRLATMIVVCNGLYHSECRHEDFQLSHNIGVKNLLKLKKFGKSKFDRLLT